MVLIVKSELFNHSFFSSVSISKEWLCLKIQGHLVFSFVASIVSLNRIHAQANGFLCYKGSQCIGSRVAIKNEFPNYKTK